MTWLQRVETRRVMRGSRDRDTAVCTRYSRLRPLARTSCRTSHYNSSTFVSLGSQN